MDAAPEEISSGPWRRGWASVGAVVGTILLIALVIMVTISNRDRDRALAWERHTRDVIMMTQAVDATIARSEAALGRYVVDERKDTANLYYNDWRLAGRQIERLRQMVVGDRRQLDSVAELKALYAQRGQELSLAAHRNGAEEAELRPRLLLPGRAVAHPADAARPARHYRRPGKGNARSAHAGNADVRRRGRPVDDLARLGRSADRHRRHYPGPDRLSGDQRTPGRPQGRGKRIRSRRGARTGGRGTHARAPPRQRTAARRSGRARRGRSPVAPGAEARGGRPAYRRHSP